MKGKITPHTGFRLPKRTLDELQMLVEMEVIRNFTEGVIIAVEHLATEYRTQEKMKQKLTKNVVIE